MQAALRAQLASAKQAAEAEAKAEDEAAAAAAAAEAKRAQTAVSGLSEVLRELSGLP